MTGESPGSITRVIKAIGEGDPKASAELLPLVYAELRRIARSLVGRSPHGQTLQPTSLVHQAYLRLVGDEDPGWNSKGHFLAAAAAAMRQILVEEARRKASKKHGGGLQRLDVDDVDLMIEPVSEDILALEEALGRLEKSDPRPAKVVMLRYFAGLTAEETAAMMNLSLSTIEREWRLARSILYTELKGNPGALP